MERDLKLRCGSLVEVSARTRFDVVNSGKADMECGRRSTIRSGEKLPITHAVSIFRTTFLVRSTRRFAPSGSGWPSHIGGAGHELGPLLKQRLKAAAAGGGAGRIQSYDEAREAGGEVSRSVCDDRRAARRAARQGQGSVEACDCSSSWYSSRSQSFCAKRHRVQESS